MRPGVILATDHAHVEVQDVVAGLLDRNAGSSRIVSVQAGSVVVTTGTPTTAITGCALGSISGLVGSLLASSAQDAIDATLPALIADLTAQIDTALAATPVIVCD